MKICIIVEGAYPYITGGVSSWIQRMLMEFSQYKDIEFIIQTIIVDRNQERQIKYDIPDNVTEIREIYLFDSDYVTEKKHIDLTTEQYSAFRSLFFGEDIDWKAIFTFFQQEEISLNALLSSKVFLELTKEYYLENYSDIVFTDFLWSMRSMYQPLFTIMKAPHIEADIYHSLSTGYSGIVASMQSFIADKPYLLSEHGIYTREREEEIIKADWVKGIYKDLWINQFYKLSNCSYDMADRVTSLFQNAANIQIDLGCSPEKIKIIANGVDIEKFENLERTIDSEMINIGAILRVAPIKDVKTMISSFYLAKKADSRLKLWIMGPVDENDSYARECKELVSELEIKDVVFTGTINVMDYIGSMDIMILSSLSEGQPLVILEGFAAKKPFIATDVGDCRRLISGYEDDFGPAGIIVPLMNTDQMSKAMIKLADDKQLRIEMGISGYNRVDKFHRNQDIYNDYYDLYKQLSDKANNNEAILWQE